MPQQVEKFVLPFAIPAEDRDRPFTRDMEMAAVFYLAESEREKGGRLILKRPAENLVFIAEACYPIWLVPWRERCLVFDGLGATTHKFSYDVLPDIEAFVNEVQKSAEAREAYFATLSENINYFQDFKGKEEKTIEGLITSSDIIQDLASYLPKAEEIESPIVDKAFLSATIDESTISTSVEELSNFRATLRVDINDLSKSMKLLSTTTKEHVKVVREEIREIRKKFDEKIARVRSTVMEKVREIQGKYDAEITNVSKKFEQQLQRLYKDRVKLEKNQERLTVKIDRCEAEIKSCRLRKDEVGEVQWRRKLEECRKELSILGESVKDMDKKIEDAETAKRLELSTLRSNYDTQVEAAMKGLRELEASCEARVRMKQQEMKSLEDMTSEIINQLNEMAKLKKAALKELDGMGMPERERKRMFVYLPLYFTCYEADLKKRYVVYPPSVVGSMGILIKFKGVFGITKMKSLLQHYSKPITRLLNQLLTLIKEDPVFEKEISDAGVQASILRTKESRECVKKGLKELRDEGWISESELQTFSELLTKP